MWASPARVGASWRIPGADEKVDNLQSTILEQSPDTVSFRDLKALVAKLLPPKSMLRILISSEPDILDRTSAMAKLEIYVRLLYSELRENR